MNSNFYVQKVIFSEWLEDIHRMAVAQWNEVEEFRKGQVLNPDYNRYVEYNEMGFYHHYIGFSKGFPVGQAGMYVMNSMHTQLLVANEDTFYLDKEHRKGRNAVKLYKFVEDDLRQMGVVDIHMTVKLTNDADRILKYLGYEHTDNGFSKHIKESV